MADPDDSSLMESLSGKWRVINTKGKFITLKSYDEIHNFSEGLALVMRGNPFDDAKYGFINTEGKEVIPLLYDDASPFTNGYASVEVNNNSHRINTIGALLVPMNDRRKERIKHYCQQLKLNFMDRNDIINHITNYYAIQSNPGTNNNYEKTLSRINQLDLLDVVKRFEEYLTQEESLLKAVQIDNPNSSEQSLWNMVYSKMDHIIQTDIDDAKNKESSDLESHSNTNKGCQIVVWGIVILWGIWYLFF